MQTFFQLEEACVHVVCIVREFPALLCDISLALHLIALGTRGLGEKHQNSYVSRFSSVTHNLLVDFICCLHDTVKALRGEKLGSCMSLAS